MASLHPDALRLQLSQLSPRAALLLRWRLLERRTDAACAERLGVSLPAYEIHLLRAARELEAKQRGELPALEADFAEESREATQLTQALEAALDGRTPPLGPSEIEALATSLVPYSELGPEILQSIDRAERAYEQSPAFRREVWLRRLLVALVLALTAWFYTRSGVTTFEPRPGLKHGPSR